MPLSYIGIYYTLNYNNINHKKITGHDKVFLALLRKQPEMTQKELAGELGWTVNTVKYYLNKIKIFIKKAIKHQSVLSLLFLP